MHYGTVTDRWADQIATVTDGRVDAIMGLLLHGCGLIKHGTMTDGWADARWYRGIRVGRYNMVPRHMGGPMQYGTVMDRWANARWLCSIRVGR